MMSPKAFLVFCLQGYLIQTAFSQCLNRVGGLSPYSRTGLTTPGLRGSTLAAVPSASGYNGLSSIPDRVSYNSLYTPTMDFTATSGGSLAVTSTSAIAPTGITVVSENTFEGPLEIAGELPFVGTTGVEGAIASAGSGAVDHSCGDGHTVMVSEGNIAAAVAPAASISPAGFGPTGPSSLGYGPANRLRLSGCGRSVLS